MAPVCDRNCFTCPYEDCICDDITYEDFRAEKEIDLMSGAKVYKTSSKARAIQKRYYEENKEKWKLYNAKRRKKQNAKS